MSENTANSITQEEIEKLEDMVKGLSDTELQIVLRNLPSKSIWREMMRRDNEREELIAGIKNVMKGA